MANGELIAQIDAMLEAGTIPTKACNRIILQLLSEMYRKQTNIETRVNKIYPAYQFTMWLGGAMGISVVALIWGIVTHQITLSW
jgi:hypothetical protein